MLHPLLLGHQHSLGYVLHAGGVGPPESGAVHVYVQYRAVQCRAVQGNTVSAVQGNAVSAVQGNAVSAVQRRTIQ